MTDTFSKTIRSYIMSCVKSKNTKPEIIVRKFLYKIGYRYRINFKKLPGSPDIVFQKYRVAIFINGCFWHGHQNCKRFRIPKTKEEYWINKIQKNIIRDELNQQKLKNMGWKVYIIWECQLNSKNINTTLSLLDSTLNNIVLDYYS